MNHSIIEQKKEYEVNRRRQKRWKSLVTALACVVVFCTTYALILPAITLENTAYCGYEEHTHSEECYQVMLTCEETDKEIEIEHEHNAACYISEQDLICTLEETEEILETEEPIDLEEIEISQPHQHSDGCYETKEIIVCDQETETIIEEHIHTESCYESVFVCEKPEHMHEKQCYSNPDADVETAEVWEAALPETLTGDYRSNLIAVAESQLGYKESKKNYIVAEDGDIKGYSRYGAWYGSSYGDWCAMYISFCLNYAGIDESVMPREAGCQNWIEILSDDEYQLYHLAEEYNPIPGDLIFFNNDAEEDSDHVGIVTETIAATEEEEAKIQVIEGNISDEVAYKTYYLSDSTIMGYGSLPDKSEETLGEVPEETAAPVKFALRNSADTYAPEGVTLTGVWSEDVIAIANSQIGYTEVSSLSKYDQWVGNDGTNKWNVNFVNYCLSYAGVDKDVIPWNTSYDFSQWRSALESAGVYKTYEQGKISTGDIVFVQDWNVGTNYNVGVCVEYKEGAYYIAFGDMDGNGKVTKEQFWPDWTSRLLGYVSLSENLETSVDGILTATVGYNGGTLPQGTELAVEFAEENAAYAELVKEYVQSTGNLLEEDYYLNVYFTKNGERFEPEDEFTIHISFAAPLSPGVSELGETSWLYGLVEQEEVYDPDWMVQTATDSSNCITEATVVYQPNVTYVLAGVQENNIKLTAKGKLGETDVMAAAVGNAAALSETMQMEIRFIEEPAEAWISKIEETYKKDKERVSSNVFFELMFKDAEGNPVTLPEDSKVKVTLDFTPPVSSALADGSVPRSGSWKLNGLDAASGNIILEEADTKVTTAKNISLESAAFDYHKKQCYALSAVVVDPAYAFAVNSYEELSNILQNGESITQIKLGADIAVPFGGGFTVGSGKKVFLDLNGHDITTSGTLFTVKDGGQVSIFDDKAAAETIEQVAEMHLRADEDGDSEAQLAANKANAGMLASYDAASETLTYYVTETEITDPAIGATKETLVKHTAVFGGTIKGGSEAVIKVEGGIFCLESGGIAGCTNSAIEQSGGTLKLNGGYICGNHKSSGDGGAICSTGDAKIQVDGTVIAANSSQKDGGAIYINGKELIVNTGVISGNSAKESGGGVFATGSTVVEFHGGFLTNNRAESTEYRGGGGGIFTNEQANIHLSGGYVTGNYAESGGGGIRTFASKFRMMGGFINSNYANLSEGGGLSVNEYGTGEILGGYINNNVSNTHQHWGGGGIFSANDSTLYIKRILVTNNDAGGYGGGVAGCSTGRAFVYEEDGGAIYNNTAVDRNSDNPHISGGESTKAEDHLYPTSVFRENGYEDYFCAFNSIISGTLLGGGAANWTGTIDGLPVTIAKNEEASSTYLMGLISSPSNGDIAKAQENARVYVNGNDSYTHGGGVLGNGYLVIGNTDSIEVYARLKVDATKEMTGAELKDGQFRFVIEDFHTGFLIATGINNADGEITFDHLIPFTEEGTYEYLIYEDHTSENGEYAGILMDTTEYKVTVAVEKTVEWLQKTVKKDKFIITSIKVEKRNGGEWEQVQLINDPENSDTKPVSLSLTRGATFHNVVTEYTSFSVVKRWVGNLEENAVQIQLLRDGIPYGTPVELNAANHWTYKWEKELPLYSWKDGEKVFHTYSVEELNIPEDYQVAYDCFNTTESDAVWIPYMGTTLELEKDYIIVAPDGKHVMYVSNLGADHTITEADKASVIKQTQSITINGQEHTDYYYDGTILEGSVYRAQNTDGLRLNLPAADYRAIAVPSDGTGFNLQSSWWPLRNLYVGNTQVCVRNQQEDQSSYMIVYENGKFDAVSYNPWNSNAAKLYTLAYTDLSNETIFTVTNTKIEEDVLYKLDITKISAENSAVLLAGAEFALYPMDENGEANLEYPAVFTRTAAGAYRYLRLQNAESLTSADAINAVTARGGKLVISDIPKGDYVLIETKAPNGYQVTNPIKIHLGDENSQSATCQMTIEDEPEKQPGYMLPETGGTGRTQDRLTGILLIGIAILLYIQKKKRNFRGKHS